MTRLRFQATHIRQPSTGSDRRSLVGPVTFDVEPGETIALCGSTGSGKSLLIELAAGLRAPDSGETLLDSESIHRIRPDRRGVGLLTQDAALYEHLGIRENIGFALGRGDHSDAIDRAARASGCHDLITGHRARTVASLSGGERRRVGLAKALIGARRLLLLDEPFEGLDPVTHRTTRRQLKRALESRDHPTIIAVHDVADAIALGDRVALLEEGELLQIDAPATLLRHPADSRVALRFATTTPCLIHGVSDGESLDLPGGSIRPSGPHPTGDVDVLVDSDAITTDGTMLHDWIVDAHESTADGIDLLLRHREDLDAQCILRTPHRSDAAAPTPGTQVSLDIDPARIRILPRFHPRRKDGSTEQSP